MILRTIVFVMATSICSVAYAEVQNRIDCKILATGSSLAKGVSIDAFSVNPDELSYYDDTQNPKLSSFNFEALVSENDFPGVRFEGQVLIEASFEKWSSEEGRMPLGLMLSSKMSHRADTVLATQVYSSADNFVSAVLSTPGATFQFYCTN